MDVMDRASSIKDEIKSRRLESRAEHAQQQLDRLKMENETLKSEVDRDHERIESLLEGLQDVVKPPSGSKHRLRRLMTLTIAAAGAYVMGAKAGRDRYEQIKDKVQGFRDRSTTNDEWDMGSTGETSTGGSTSGSLPTT